MMTAVMFFLSEYGTISFSSWHAMMTDSLLWQVRSTSMPLSLRVLITAYMAYFLVRSSPAQMKPIAVRQIAIAVKTNIGAVITFVFFDVISLSTLSNYITVSFS